MGRQITWGVLSLAVVLLLVSPVLSSGVTEKDSDAAWGLDDTLAGVKGAVQKMKEEAKEINKGPDVAAENRIAEEQEGDKTGLEEDSDLESDQDSLVGGGATGRFRAGSKANKMRPTFKRRQDSAKWVQNSISNSAGNIAESAGGAVVALAKKKRRHRHVHVPRPPNWRNNYNRCVTIKPQRGSWNYRGWQNCPASTYQTGLYRGGCDSINCIDGFNCCQPKNSLHNGWTCYAQNMWSRFDRKGWHHCDKPGYFMNGWWKNSGNWLYHIENFHCCKPTWSEPKYDHCYTENWWGSMDRRGWSVCRQPNHFIQGIYRNHCNHLHCLEMAHCCSPTYPRPATDVSLTKGATVAFPGTKIARGRHRLSTSVLRDWRPYRPTRRRTHVVRFKSQFFGAPKVHLSLSLLDTQRRVSQKVDAFVERVYSWGFKYRIQTWGDALVYGLHVEWMAVGRDAGAYVKDRKKHYKIRQLLRYNTLLRKYHYTAYVRLAQLQKRLRAFHVHTLQQNTKLRQARKDMEAQLKTMTGKSQQTWAEIEHNKKMVRKMRLEMEKRVKTIGHVPRSIKKVWNFATKAKKWASRTLMRLKKKSVKATDLVRADMSNVWSKNKLIDQEVTLSIMELERDLKEHIRMKQQAACGASGNANSCARSGRRDVGGGPGTSMMSSRGKNLPYGNQLTGKRGRIGAEEMNEKVGEHHAPSSAENVAQEQSLDVGKDFDLPVSSDGLKCKCTHVHANEDEDSSGNRGNDVSMLELEEGTEDSSGSLDDLLKPSGDPAEMPGTSMLDAAGAEDTLADVSSAPEDQDDYVGKGSSEGDGSEAAGRGLKHKKREQKHRHKVHKSKGKRKCVCVPDKAADTSNSTNTAKPMVLSLLFEDGVTIPPSIQMVDDLSY